MKRIINVILSAGIAMNLFIATTQAAYEEKTMQPAAVVNADFEQPVIVDASADTNDPDADKKSDTIMGWVNNNSSYDAITPGMNKFTIEKDPTNENNNCLMVLDTRVAASGLSTTNVWSDLIPVNAGDTVQTDMSVYLQYESIGINESGTTVNSRALYLKIWYFNASGISIGSAPQYTHSNVTTNINKWIEVSMPSVVTPAGTAYIRVNVMCTNAHTTKSFVDNITVNIMKTKSIGDPQLSAGTLPPSGNLDMSLNITNNTNTDFPVFSFFALFNQKGELLQLQNMDNNNTLKTSGTISSSMSMPSDVTGFTARIMVFNLKDGRIVPYYKWVNVSAASN